MSVAPTVTYPLSAEPLAGHGVVRPEQPGLIPNAGGSSNGETQYAKTAPFVPASPEDEVKVQWDQPDQVVVYQFINQQGSLILQVPSEQMLNIARDISQELAQAAAPKPLSGTEGGKK